MDGIGRRVKNVIYRKVKSNQLVIHSPLEFSEAVTKVLPSFRSVYLPENKKFVKPEDLSMARNINQTSKIHKLERNCSQNGDT